MVEARDSQEAEEEFKQPLPVQRQNLDDDEEDDDEGQQ